MFTVDGWMEYCPKAFFDNTRPHRQPILRCTKIGAQAPPTVDTEQENTKYPNGTSAPPPKMSHKASHADREEANTNEPSLTEFTHRAWNGKTVQ
jgi:hypothetical protein